MTNFRFLAPRLSLGLLAVAGALSTAGGCGSDDGKRRATDSAGAAGEAGAAPGNAGGSASDPGAGGAGSPGAAGEAPLSPGGSGGATGGGEGGGAGAPADNPDLDGDGFPNDIDPDPNDPTLPGDFSSVEKILADPLIDAALSALEGAEIDLAISTAETPPDLTGFYSKPDGAGSFTATSNDVDIGRTVIGLEHFDVLHPGGLFDSKVAGFVGNALALSSEGVGNFVRGSGVHFSSFSRDTSLCTQGGSNYRTWSIRIVTGDQEAGTGDVIDLKVLAVTVAVAGTLTPACEALLAGESELVGGWSLWQVARDAKINPATLTFLCVDDDDSVHLPGDMFTDASDATCTCDAGVLTCE